MNPTSQFDKCKQEAFAKHGIDPNKKNEPSKKSESSFDPPKKPFEPPDMGGLQRPQRTTPPDNGVWRMPLLSGKYFMLTFVNGEKHGIATQWSDKDVCTMETHFEHNILNGPCRLFDSLGRITTAFTYENGLMHGYLVSYQPSGLIAYESWYVHGVQEGLMRTYGQYGDLVQECTYKNNYRHGACITYFPKNQGVCQIAYFENGLQTGDEQLFYPNGNLMQVVPYKDGLAKEYPNPVDMDGKPIVNPYTVTKPPSSAASLTPPAPWDVGGAPIIDKTSRLSHPI